MKSEMLDWLKESGLDTLGHIIAALVIALLCFILPTPIVLAIAITAIFYMREWVQQQAKSIETGHQGTYDFRREWNPIQWSLNKNVEWLAPSLIAAIAIWLINP